MTSLLSQIEAAAALGEKANPMPYKWSGGDKWSPKYLDDDGGSTVVEAASEVVGYDNYRLFLDVTPDNQAYIVAAANLPLSAIAEELRAKDAEIAKLLTILDDSGAGKMHRRCQKAESLLRRFVKYADSINRHGSDAFMALVKEAEALAAKESAND